MLAFLAIRKHLILRQWPGVHEAAAWVASKSGTGDAGPEYPYYDTWFNTFLSTNSAATDHRGRPVEAVRQFTVDSELLAVFEGLATTARTAGDSGSDPWVPTPEVYDAAPPGQSLAAFHEEEYEAEWVATKRGMVDVSDTWDVWILVRMLQCQADDDVDGFPHDVFTAVSTS